MRLLTIITICFFTTSACRQPVDPDSYVKYYRGDITQDYAWRHHVERKIVEQLADKGLQRSQSGAALGFMLIGTWDAPDSNDDFYVTEKIRLSLINRADMNQPAAHDFIYGKMLFTSDRKAAWCAGWTFAEPNELARVVDIVVATYEKIKTAKTAK